MFNISAIPSHSSQWGYPSLNQLEGTRNTSAKVEADVVQKADTPDLTSTQQVANVSAQSTGGGAVPGESLSSMVSGMMAEMAASTPVKAAAASPMAASSGSLADLYRFTNQYLYGTSSNTWAKIDTNADGVWDATELQAYADAYEKATGNTLNVQDILDTYGDGVELDYFGQKAAYEADALGISDAKQALIYAEWAANSGSSSSGKINEKALQDFADKFTYGYPGKMWANIDQDKDGMWSLDELYEYAKAYEKATGDKLDIETLMAKYDRDGDGVLNYYEQNDMYKDDALGLSAIKDALNAQKAAESDKNTGADKDSGSSIDFGKYTSSLSASQKQGLAKAFNQGMQKAAMLDAFMAYNFTVNNRFTPWGSYGYGGYGMGYQSAWYAGSIGMLNLFA